MLGALWETLPHYNGRQTTGNRLPSTEKVLPEHQCKLAKPTKPNGLYQFPRALNLVGPPCEGGHLLIRSPRVDSGDDRGSPGGGTRRTGDTGGDNARVLRLAVSIKAGPPAKVLIRSPALGVEEFSSEIRTTQLAGFKVGECCNGWISFWMGVTSTCWMLHLLLGFFRWSFPLSN